MCNQDVPIDSKFSEPEDSTSEKYVIAQPYLAKFLRDVAQLLNNAADYLERR